MGCYNGTCGVSHLAIQHHDPVVFIPLIRNSHIDIDMEYGEHFCWPTSIWQPLCLPMEAEYDDYGFIENVKENKCFEQTMKYIQKNLIEREQGENQYHEQAVIRDEFTFEKFGELLHDTRLRLTGYRYSVPVSFMLVHKSIYDTFISRTTSGYHKTYSKDIISSLLMEESKKCGDRFFFKNEEFYKDFFGVSSIIYNNLNDEFRIEIFDSVAGLWMFNESLMKLRMHYAPQSGAGSQDTEWELHQLLHKEKTKIIRKQRYRW